MNPLKSVSVNSSTKPKEQRNLPITYGFSDDMATCTNMIRGNRKYWAIHGLPSRALET